MTLNLTLPYPPKELHPNFRALWQVKMGVRKEYRWGVAVLALRQLGNPAPRLAPPVTAYLTFAFGVKRDRDEDNLLAACKSLFDGLVDARVLAGDDSKALHHGPVTVVVEPGLKAPEVRVRLETEER
jgi:crossover junction endodeoxyribonuclease RusA